MSTTIETPPEAPVKGGLADRIEQELDRMRALRPRLASRIGRAEDLLITHLACPRQRVIRVRVGTDSKARFLVRGSKGAVYIVDPANGFSCSCPDAEHRGAGCYHGIACFVLQRAARRGRRCGTAQPAERPERRHGRPRDNRSEPRRGTDTLQRVTPVRDALWGVALEAGRL